MQSCMSLYLIWLGPAPVLSVMWYIHPIRVYFLSSVSKCDPNIESFMLNQQLSLQHIWITLSFSFQQCFIQHWFHNIFSPSVNRYLDRTLYIYKFIWLKCSWDRIVLQFYFTHFCSDELFFYEKAVHGLFLCNIPKLLSVNEHCSYSIKESLSFWLTFENIQICLHSWLMFWICDLKLFVATVYKSELYSALNGRTHNTNARSI